MTTKYYLKEKCTCEKYWDNKDQHFEDCGLGSDVTELIERIYPESPATSDWMLIGDLIEVVEVEAN